MKRDWLNPKSHEYLITNIAPSSCRKLHHKHEMSSQWCNASGTLFRLPRHDDLHRQHISPLLGDCFAVGYICNARGVNLHVAFQRFSRGCMSQFSYILCMFDFDGRWCQMLKHASIENFLNERWTEIRSTPLRFTPSRGSQLVLLKTYLRYIQAKWRFPKMVCGCASIQLYAGKMLPVSVVAPTWYRQSKTETDLN